MSLIRSLKKYLPEPVRELGFNLLSYFQLRNWEKAGRPIPPPNKVKQNIVAEYGKNYNLKVLIETGTYLGNMIFAQRKHFSQIYSIELANEYFLQAIKRFKNHKHIHILEGNSAEVLPDIMVKLRSPALFWLDGHFSGGETAESFCPVMDELSTIIESPYQHVILVDDARCFNGTNSYPTIGEIERLLERKTKSYNLKADLDVIRITYETLADPPLVLPID